jgi:hypothetical protein
LSNKDLKFSQPKGFKMPSYFSDLFEAAPEADTFKEWPLSSTFKLVLTHVEPNPKMMQPKEIVSDEDITVYYISPRMIIRRANILSSGFPYCDHFTIENKWTFTQIEGENGRPKTHFKGEFRYNQIKPIRFI